MSEHKIIIESASLADIRTLIETRDKWGDSGAPVWIALSEDNARTGVVRWSLRSSYDRRSLALGSIEARRITEGISLRFQTPEIFPDPGMFHFLIDETTEEIEERGYRVQPVAPLPPHPPKPAVHGWDATFDWYYEWQKRNNQRMMLRDLADKINYAEQTVKDRKCEYDAEHRGVNSTNKIPKNTIRS